MKLAKHLSLTLLCIVCISTLVLLSRKRAPSAPSPRTAPPNEKTAHQADPAGRHTDPTIFDAGYLMDGDFVQHTFVFTNHTPHKLKIKQVRSTCSCSVIEADIPPELASNASMEIPISMHAIGAPGEHLKRVVYVETHNSDPIPLKIKYNLVSGFPRSVDFGRLKRGDAPVKTFFIRTYPTSSINVKRLEYDTSFFAVAHEQDPNDRSSVKFSVSLKSDIDFGIFQKHLEILTDEKDKSKKTILLQGYVLRKLETDQKRIFLGTINHDTPFLMRNIDVRCPYGDQISDLEINSSNDSVLSCTISDTDDKTRVSLIIKMGNPNFEGMHFLSEKLNIKASIDGTPHELEIAVLAIKQ